jgi:diguanylate cyclase (GGDEF)-like protein
MFLGLDRFKIINDSLGHAVGDNLLINVSKRLQEILPKNTLFARWDGDKFIILLNMNKEQSYTLAKHILEIINQPIFIGNQKLTVTLSIGISVCSNDIKNSSTLIKNADIAMYSAKDRGKNRFEYYDKKSYINIKSRLNIEQELQYGLEQNEFILNYQPQYDMKSKKVVSVEALIRWHSKKLGRVSPVDFIYIAEDTGFIVELGYYIFEEACKAYMRWLEVGIKLDMIAINVSSIQFREDDFLEKIKVIIDRVGISPNSIEIELTESYILEYSSSNISILNSLRELGCNISIDDFGTGYSSMSYLKELPVDTVKIDQSFISDLSTNKYDKTVSQAIIALAHSLDYKVVAEGIETVEQDKLLEEYNCDIGQGYLVSKPLEESKLIEFILSHNKKI